MPVGELYALIAAASWAVGSLLFAKIGKRVSPGAMNLGKCISAAFVLVLARAALTPSLGSPAWLPEAAALLAVSGVIGLTIGDTAYFGAIVSIGVPRAILLLSAAPVFAAIGGVVFLGERVGPREAAGIALTLAGIALVVTGRARPSQPPATALAPSGAALASGAPAAPVASLAPVAALVSGAPVAPATARRGVALGIVAAVCQASGSLLARRAMKLGVDPLAASAARLVTGAVSLIALALLTGHARRWVRELRAGRAWLSVAGAAQIGTVGGIWLSQLAIHHCASTGVATTLLATSPIFALPLAHFTGQERITARAAAGTALAIAGVVLLSLRPS
ncbi:MAG: DMT family transporter [Polyangiaceae bacterium]